MKQRKISQLLGPGKKKKTLQNYLPNLNYDMTILGEWGAGAGKVVHVRKELGSKKKIN